MTFLDTSGLLAMHSEREADYALAVRLASEGGPFLTSSYVLAELIALGERRRVPRRPLLHFVRVMLSNKATEVVWVDESLNDAALALLEARRDKGYSLCDAVSFVLMRQRGLDAALTADHHFEQEGFRCLLRPH